MVILTWLQKRFYWFLLKMTPKWNFSSTMPQTGHGNQVKCYQISTICLITAGQRIDREIMTKINKLFNHLEFQFCEMFHCMVVTYKVKNERMTKRNVCLQKAWLWKQEVIVFLSAHHIQAASMRCKKDGLWQWVEGNCQERDEKLDKGVWIESEEKAVMDTEKDKRRNKRSLHVGQANPVVQEALALLVDPAWNKEQKGRILLSF